MLVLKSEQDYLHVLNAYYTELERQGSSYITN